MPYNFTSYLCSYRISFLASNNSVAILSWRPCSYLNYSYIFLLIDQIYSSYLIPRLPSLYYNLTYYRQFLIIEILSSLYRTSVSVALQAPNITLRQLFQTLYRIPSVDFGRFLENHAPHLYNSIDQIVAQQRVLPNSTREPHVELVILLSASSILLAFSAISQIYSFQVSLLSISTPSIRSSITSLLVILILGTLSLSSSLSQFLVQ